MKWPLSRILWRAGLAAAILIGASAPAQASEYRLVRSGETVESIAESLGDPAMAEALRFINGLEPGEQPAVGDLIRVPSDAALTEDSGRVVALSGSGTATPPGCAPQPLERDMRLPPETRICTGEDGYVTVRLAASVDGRAHDDMLLLPGTCAVLDAASSREGARTSVVSLDVGSLRVLSARDAEGTVTVRTGSAVASGGGGGFRVTVEDDEATRTEALYSEIDLIGAGAEVAVGAGEGSRVRPGEAPSDPIPLLEPGDPLRPFDGEALRRPDFSWRPVEGALGYRIEVSASPEFDQLVHVQGAPDPEWSPAVLLLPHSADGLWWRVASFDRFGFLGVPSEPRWLVFPSGVGP